VEVTKNEKKRPASSTAGPRYSSLTAMARLSRGVVRLNNSNTHNPVTDDIQKPNNNLTGFIYSTYSAAKRENHRDKSLNNRSNQDEAYASSTIGGSLSQISFEGSKPSSRTDSTYGGGVRGKIRGFSRVSCRNLLRKLSSINRTAFRAFKGRLIFATLTYPTNYPEDPKVCKKHLEAF
jgi:hypothetical protein